LALPHRAKVVLVQAWGVLENGMTLNANISLGMTGLKVRAYNGFIQVWYDEPILSGAGLVVKLDFYVGFDQEH
jgi:hypothetical protein